MKSTDRWGLESNKVLYSKGKNDECYTPEYAVQPILKYIPENAVVWCPFDQEHSFFVKKIQERNKVINSHIFDGQDFYTYEPDEHWDIIVSNPPFTNKRQIFERALFFNKPFALLMSNTWLNDSAPKYLFENRDLELLMFDKRIQYFKDGKSMGSPTFSSSYYCWNFLPKQIIMEGLSK